MEKLKFTDGAIIDIFEGNSVTEIKTVVQDAKGVKALKELLTVDNTETVYFINGEKESLYEHLKPTDITITLEGDDLVATFGLYPLSEEELRWRKLKKENAVRDEAMAEIAELQMWRDDVKKELEKEEKK